MGKSGFNEKGKDGFWPTKDFGRGCSGPSGNEGSTRDKWYKKKVLVILRSDREFAIKCKSNFDSAIKYIRVLISNDDFDQAKQCVDMISNCKLNLKESEAVTVLEMCNQLNEKNLMLEIMKHLSKFSICSPRSAEILAIIVNTFSDPEIRRRFQELVQNSEEKNISEVLNCLTRVTNNFKCEEFVKLSIELVNNGGPLNASNNGMYKGFSSNYGSQKPFVSDLEIILGYMITHKVFPETETNQLIDDIREIHAAVSLLSSLFSSGETTILHHKLLQLFTSVIIDTPLN